MVLKTLQVMAALHGYGIARRIEQMAEGALALNQGTIYPALLRLEQKGWIESEWGTSENNRRARFYSITRAGRKQLTDEEDRRGGMPVDAARAAARREFGGVEQVKELYRDQRGLPIVDTLAQDQPDA